jgi:hypothetical protein
VSVQATSPVLGLKRFRTVLGAGGKLTVEANVCVPNGPKTAWKGWQARSMRSLLEYAVDSPEWRWLKENGINRPSPTRSRAERGGDVVEVRLTPEASRKLDRDALKLGSRQAAALAAILAYDPD